MKKYLIPIIIYLVFIALYIGISRSSHNDYLFLPIWDIRHYLDISEIGYQVYPCTPGVDGYAGQVCGNSGWFPMWPLTVKLIRPLLGGSSKTTFIGLVFLFTLLFFILLFRFMERYYGLKAAVITLSAIAFGPASFYLLTGFPYALLCLLLMIYLLLLYHPQTMAIRIGLFLIALAISLSYPTGILMALLPTVYFIGEVSDRKQSFRSPANWINLAGYVVPFILGPLLLWLYFYLEYDDFFLQLHFQEKYHRTWAIPFWIMLKSLFKEPLVSPENLSILWFGLTFIIFFPFRLRRELWILGIVMYLFSLTTGTTMSIYRHYLIIIPIYMIIGSSDRPLWLKTGYIILGLLIALKVLFPLFMAYRLM
nr:hypothetical protein [candidate division Zixibacteria bacterium]